jgi:hypothetical protein
VLGEAGINATVRRNRGTDIDAACGQLAARAASRSEMEPDGAVPVVLSSPAAAGGTPAEARS